MVGTGVKEQSAEARSREVGAILIRHLTPGSWFSLSLISFFSFSPSFLSFSSLQ
jgi:hypothetical protein